MCAIIVYASVYFSQEKDAFHKQTQKNNILQSFQTALAEKAKPTAITKRVRLVYHIHTVDSYIHTPTCPIVILIYIHAMSTFNDTHTYIHAHKY